jgi:hypothetical protein
LQRFYKRLADLYQRYPNRWAKEKGYSDADYYLDRTRKLLMALKAGLEGRPLPDTGERRERRPLNDVQRHIMAQGYRGERMGGRDWSPEFQPEEQYEEEDFEPTPPPRMIRPSTGGSRFVPATKSKSRSVRPAFMRKR